MSFTLEIRQEHVNRGVPGSSTGCAVALAMSETLGRPVAFRIEHWVFLDEPWEGRRAHGSPEDLQRFAVAFDRRMVDGVWTLPLVVEVPL